MIPLVPGLKERLDEGIDAADVGAGAGHAINVLARAFTRSRFVGYDFSDEGLRLGAAEAQAWGLQNVRFEVRDVANLGEQDAFDFITAFDAIHDQAKPRSVLKGIHDALRPGGVFLMMDEGASSRLEENIDSPLTPLLYTFSTFHCMTVSLAYGGEGLGTCLGRQKALELLAEAGFTDVDVQTIEGISSTTTTSPGRGRSPRPTNEIAPSQFVEGVQSCVVRSAVSLVVSNWSAGERL